MNLSVCLILLSGFWPALQQHAFAEEPFFIGVEGDALKLKTVEVKSDHVYDYTFTGAPSDWRVQSGKWGLTNRWTCAPGWSWFGGRSEEIAAIWNKRKFSGDFSLHVYFAFKEHAIRDGQSSWREKQSDVGITFCGDGNNLGSGYALILGADNNGRTVLLKQGQVVLESLAVEARFPSMVDGVPLAWERSVVAQSATQNGYRRYGFDSSSGRAHGQTHWWHAIIDKFDNRIECWLDGKLLFAYDDTQPLNEGQIALWTFNNGIVLSRVQIYYKQEMKRSFVKNSVPGEPIAGQGVSEPVLAEKEVR